MSILRSLPVSSLFLAAMLLAAASPRSKAQTSPANSAQTAGSTVSSDPDLHDEVEQLRQLVHEQQKRIEALEAEHKSDTPSRTLPATDSQKAIFLPEASSTSASSAAPTLNASLSAPVLPDAQAPTAAAQSVSAQGLQSGSTDERVRNLERQIKGLGPISFSGDVRLRAEPFFGGPTNESLDRMRERVRVRFNAFADLGSQFKAGVSLASGDVNNPISTNQDLTGFYTRKPIELDQAFVQYTPDQFKNLTLVGGKFRYPWYNTELTWDKDLNPEGAAESLSFNIPSPVFKRIAFIGFQLPFAAVAGTSSTDQRIAQQITYGGQIQTVWQLAPHVTLGAYSAIYDFRGSDSIAYALARAATKNPQTPFVGLLPLTSGNPVPNSTYTTTASTVVTIGGTAYPTGVTSVSNAQFASKFSLFDNIARLDIDTGHSKYPISFIGDYVQNMGACSNLANIVRVPANTSTQTYKQTLNTPCVSNQRRGYWAEGRIGRLEEKHDFQIGYTRIYIENEAVLGNFNYSELRQGTNVTQHRIDAFYQFDKSVQLGFAALIGRPLASTEPWLYRLQFDTIYIF
jgi:Putative porin